MRFLTTRAGPREVNLRWVNAWPVFERSRSGMGSAYQLTPIYPSILSSNRFFGPDSGLIGMYVRRESASEQRPATDIR